MPRTVVGLFLERTPAMQSAATATFAAPDPDLL
jgi:hypothetical protein